MTKTQPEPCFRSLLEDHEELREMIAGLHGFLQTPRPFPGQTGAHSWAAELAPRLVALHDRLFRHFRAEESSGALVELARLHPRRITNIQALAQEHDGMITDLRELVTDVLWYSEGHWPEDPRLRQRLISLLQRLARHEEAETDLMQRIVYRELGGGD